MYSMKQDEAGSEAGRRAEGEGIWGRKGGEGRRNLGQKGGRGKKVGGKNEAGAATKAGVHPMSHLHRVRGTH